MHTEVRRLTPDLVPQFHAVHSPAEGEGWCACVAWWVPSWDGWGDRSAEQNQALRAELFARGEHDGYLFYAGGALAGWCQAGLRDRLPNLVRTYALAPSP